MPDPISDACAEPTEVAIPGAGLASRRYADDALGEWHRRSFGATLGSDFALEEREASRSKASNGGQMWAGEIDGSRASALTFAATEQPRNAEIADSPTPSSSGESFDMMHGAEAERSTYFNGYDNDDDSRYHAHPQETITGTAVFDKM